MRRQWMSRLSQRIGSALVGVKCPGCGKHVMPTVELGEPAESSAPGKRWSFVWRPPSGDVCPECRFPLGRYARRVKWIRLFIAGITLLLVDGGLVVIGVIRASPMSPALVRTVGIVGAIALFGGLIGLIVGGRSEAHPPGS
jgi:hypothetical protein